MKAVLLDRDGTVIAEPPDECVDSVQKIELFPDTIEALRYLASHSFAVIFVTNQAGIAEGRITMADFKNIHEHVKAMLASSGVTILETYMCPHGPKDDCNCRKPKPTLLLRAIQEHNLDSQNTYFIGDRSSDIVAGMNAGVKAVLVKTATTPAESTQATYNAPTLLDAVKYVVAHS